MSRHHDVKWDIAIKLITHRLSIFNIHLLETTNSIAVLRQKAIGNVNQLLQEIYFLVSVFEAVLPQFLFTNICISTSSLAILRVLDWPYFNVWNQFLACPSVELAL